MVPSRTARLLPGRWLALASLAVACLAAQAQRQATATATVMNGFVVAVTMTDAGTGYTVPPAVSFAGGGGSGATATATVTNGAVSQITVLTTGSGYSSVPAVVIAPPDVAVLSIQMAPWLEIEGDPGSTARLSYAESATPAQWVVVTNVVLTSGTFAWGDPDATAGQRNYTVTAVPPDPRTTVRTATGTATVFNGFVIGITITDGGAGYLTAPTVSVTGPGTGATAAATISGGVVTQVTIQNTGSGYASAEVNFSAPPPLANLTLTQRTVPRVTVRQNPPTDHALYSTTNLASQDSWQPRAVISPTTSGTPWFDVTASGAASRFYRVGNVVAPPGMVFIPSGTFLMGHTFAEGAAPELNLHTVHVSAFYMGQHEVTKALWDEVRVWANAHGYDLGTIGSGKATNHPVHSVNWYDVVKWCNARSEKEGLVPAYYANEAQTAVYRAGAIDVQNEWVKWNAGYRLPTEAEWEKAARGGVAGRRFSWGDSDLIQHSRANYHSYTNSSYDTSLTLGYHPTFATGNQPYTSPVGFFAPNGYGLYDMTGNLWEWCWDWFASYSSAPQSDPHGPASGSARVYRGGGWSDDAFFCRVALRNIYGPPTRFNTQGFRIVLPPSQ